MLHGIVCFLFFFFQAEDGIRDYKVTGVQTCALPICVTFGAEIEPVVEAVAGILGESEVTGFLRDAYRPEENLGSAFARLFTRLFANWGVILLDASDRELHAIAEPIYRAAIERTAELDDALLARGQELA